MMDCSLLFQFPILIHNLLRLLPSNPMFAIKSKPAAPEGESSASPLQSGIMMAVYFGGIRLMYEFFQTEAGQNLLA